MYLDPNFGGMLIQVLVAIAAAGGIIMFSLRRKIRSLFSKNKNEDVKEDTVENTHSTENTMPRAQDDAIDMLSDEGDNVD